MVLGNNIQKLRRTLNLSQEELAEKCGVSRQSVTKWETSESTPSIDKIIMLADIFNISTDELLGRVEKDAYSRLGELVKNFVVEDIPKNEEDEVSAIISRYLLFASDMNIDAADTLKGLKAIMVIGVCAILLVLMCGLGIGIIYCETHNIKVDKIIYIGIYISLVLISGVTCSEIALIIKKNKQTDRKKINAK